MKRGCCVFLCLLLAFAAVPGLAAPSRDAEAMEVTVDERLQALLEITARAYLGPAWADVLDGRTPDPESDQATAQRPWNAVAYAMERADQDEMPLEDAKALIAEIYADAPRPEAGDPGALLTVEDGKALLNRDALENEFVLGVYPYSVSFDGETALLFADLYCTPSDAVGTMDELPEDMVIWLMRVAYELASAPEARYGFKVKGCSVSKPYLDGDLTAWFTAENTEYEYSVNLPSSFGLANGDAANRVWQTADGSASLTVQAQDGGMALDEALSAFRKAHAGDVTVERDFDFFYMVGDGCFYYVCASEMANWTYTLAMTFPRERQAEYELYAEFIKNSFSVWGLSNG